MVFLNIYCSKNKNIYSIWFQGSFKTRNIIYFTIWKFFPQECNELDDEALNRAFLRVKDKFLGYNEQKEAFRELRDGICDIVKSCADNIRVVIYIDEVLDQPITVVVGKEENRLRITIKKDGRVTFFWTKENWGKIFKEAWHKVTSFIRRIVGLITRSERTGNFSVEEENPKAITD